MKLAQKLTRYYLDVKSVSEATTDQQKVDARHTSFSQSVDELGADEMEDEAEGEAEGQDEAGAPGGVVEGQDETWDEEEASEEQTPES